MKTKRMLFILLPLLLSLLIGTKAYATDYYTVKEGDSLYKIAKKFDVTVDRLMKDNHLVSTLIMPGTMLSIGKDESVHIVVNDKAVPTDGILKDGRVLVPIRLIGDITGADTAWLPAEKNAVILFNGKVLLFKLDAKSVYINGVAKTVDVPATNINGIIYVPLRFVVENYGGNVVWNSIKKTAYLTIQKYTKPLPYTQEDLRWMAAIIHAESQGQPLHGQLAVGAVIMNRIASRDFPNTVKDVVFQPKQFTPVSNGTIYNTPDHNSMTVAKMVLNGYSVDNKALFFLNPALSTSFWIVRNRSFICSIGDHDFYR